MYYITKRDSKTGLKFANIAKRRKDCYQAQKAIANEIGFNQWRTDNWALFGGISSCIFATPPDEKIWRKFKNRNEWFPRKNVQDGKDILKRFEDLPKVYRSELNSCIGFDEEISTIGFAENNDQYFGFEVLEDWESKPPKDCKEVTYSKYKSLFPK